MRGTIKAWFSRKHYGWIKPDAQAYDCFARGRDITGTPYVGARVEFSRSEGRANAVGAKRPYATDVKVIHE
jgi:cold shock CspA family protein